MRDELVMRNVAKLVKVKTPTYEVGLGLTVDQARTLLRVSARDRLHAAYDLAVYLGLRRAEVLGLRWKGIDLDSGWHQVTQTLQRVDGELRFLPPKTNIRAGRSRYPDRAWSHCVHIERSRAANASRWGSVGMTRGCVHEFWTRSGRPSTGSGRGWHEPRWGHTLRSTLLGRHPAGMFRWSVVVGRGGRTADLPLSGARGPFWCVRVASAERQDGLLGLCGR